MEVSYLQPGLIEVHERPNLRRSDRTSPAGLHVELVAPTTYHPEECLCLNLSQHGIAILTDNSELRTGHRIIINLWNRTRRVMGLTGSVARVEQSKRFTRVVIEFDQQHVTNPALLALVSRS